MISALLLCVVFPVGLAIHQGPLLIEQDGVTTKVHVVAVSESGKLFSTDDRTLHMKHGGEIRGFLAIDEMDEMAQNNYYNFTFFNKEFSYDIDLSAVGCSCNSALFFTSMPGHNPDGTIATGDMSMNPWYCDANKVGGVWCWEHDTIEGNTYAMGTTPHICDAGPGEYTTACDKRGCQTNSFIVDPKGYCPDESCTINTLKPFRIIQKFHADASLTKLVRISNHLVQGDKSFDWDSCGDAAYLEKMTGAFKANMTMVFQLWGSDWKTMDWLDEVTGCTGDCDVEGTWTTFSNIAINTLPPASEEAVVVV